MKHHFDGDEQFHDMCELLRAAWPNDPDDVGRRFHRFNLPLGGELPDLADAGAMDELSRIAWDHFASSPAILDQAQAIIASSFYFELRRMPTFEDGRYLCHGRVLCRVSPAHPGYRSLVQKLFSLGATFHAWQGAHRARGKKSAPPDPRISFSEPVTFRVKSLDEQVDVRMKLDSSDSYHVSGSPFTAATLIRLQGLQWTRLRDPSFCCKTEALGMQKRPGTHPNIAAKRRCIRQL
ncbi:hypothetical protein DM02DRAFT_663386 [Periconia macrospinosa]|uniref:Uncharacterized protein n=1 Tax=Periconia macrospinosa TaxID=97972 RepID=A0A2V1D1U8_9PLEO|nr:hypothetical protein DM02DRAFT_663386 [Periconia macrospinosa]